MDQTRSDAPMMTISENGTVAPIPREMVFNDDSLVSVVTYVILFVIAAVGNLTVFVALYRNRKRRSRVNLFIMHLSVADMIVTFVMMPMEIGWHVTVSWKAGDVGCRVFMFFRTFGFYLSSFILIAISLDRYFAIARPLSLNDAGKRGKLMLLMAWLFSFMASVPQPYHLPSETITDGKQANHIFQAFQPTNPDDVERKWKKPRSHRRRTGANVSSDIGQRPPASD
ncbi:hypothetical protein LSH36_746g01090 [Paralvinella palmiformis]|uniref:G-protein coupled receptors family 1 profile domain-containing protein n=1 Tax=Paralvinella palmiformis TaxID=53620 RepID=A0AAD9MVJ6_9ANNE|nr:hypothetical protein LSH36_746g01090 [Paralvinella palmiformis]